MSKVVLVTGGSSGIGLYTAAALRDAGCIVYASGNGTAHKRIILRSTI